MSFRTFLRGIKNITDDADLFTAVKAYDPSVKIKTSGVRAQRLWYEADPNA